MQSTKLFWASDRKLFRQRSRLRFFVSAIAVMVVLGLTVAFRHAGWN